MPLLLAVCRLHCMQMEGMSPKQLHSVGWRSAFQHPLCHRMQCGSAKQGYRVTYQSQAACRILLRLDESLDRHGCGQALSLHHCHDEEDGELVVEDALAEGPQAGRRENVKDRSGRHGPIHKRLCNRSCDLQTSETIKNTGTSSMCWHFSCAFLPQRAVSSQQVSSGPDTATSLHACNSCSP